MLQPVLAPLASQYAPGASPEGQAISVFAQQGQPATTPVNLQMGKCYTAIAVAGPPISDLLVELVATPPAPLPPVPVAQQAGSNQVVLSGQPNCFQALAPTSGMLRVTARNGSGPVLAQLYGK